MDIVWILLRNITMLAVFAVAYIMVAFRFF